MNRYLLTYSAQEAKNPLLAQAVRDTGVIVNILTADVQYSKGQMLVSILGDVSDQERFSKYLIEKGVGVKKLHTKVIKDEDRCVDCCGCFGVCPTKAITILDERMDLQSKECISCGECVLVCPTRALSLENV